MGITKVILKIKSDICENVQAYPNTGRCLILDMIIDDHCLCHYSCFHVLKDKSSSNLDSLVTPFVPKVSTQALSKSQSHCFLIHQVENVTLFLLQTISQWGLLSTPPNSFKLHDIFFPFVKMIYSKRFLSINIIQLLGERV